MRRPMRPLCITREKRNAGVLYAANDADLTDEVIRAYDRDAGGKKK